MTNKDKIKEQINIGGVNLDDGTIYVNTRKEALAVLNKLSQIPSNRFLAVPTEVASLCSPEACILYGHFLGFNGFYGSNTSLSKSMNCSTRTISRLLNELIEKGCVKVVYASKSIRYIYPVYAIPYILNVSPDDRVTFVNKNGERLVHHEGGIDEIEVNPFKWYGYDMVNT